jgi:hypothetical protein
MTQASFVETHASVQVASSDRDAFTLMSDMEKFPSFFTGYGPIPHVVGCELVTPSPVGVGSKRLITNGDGSVLEEVVQVHVPGKEQKYRIEKGFVPPFSWMIAAAEGHWIFEPDGEQTRITWRYRFELRTMLVKPIAGFIVHGLFKRAMTRCLANMKAALE